MVRRSEGKRGIELHVRLKKKGSQEGGGTCACVLILYSASGYISLSLSIQRDPIERIIAMHIIYNMIDSKGRDMTARIPRPHRRPRPAPASPPPPSHYSPASAS